MMKLPNLETAICESSIGAQCINIIRNQHNMCSKKYAKDMEQLCALLSVVENEHTCTFDTWNWLLDSITPTGLSQKSIRTIRSAFQTQLEVFWCCPHCSVEQRETQWMSSILTTPTSSHATKLQELSDAAYTETQPKMCRECLSKGRTYERVECKFVPVTFPMFFCCDVGRNTNFHPPSTEDALGNRIFLKRQDFNATPCQLPENIVVTQAMSSTSVWTAKYDACAVVRWAGWGTVNTGHYIVARRHSDEHFYLFNDSKAPIKQKTWDDALSPRDVVRVVYLRTSQVIDVTTTTGDKAAAMKNNSISGAGKPHTQLLHLLEAADKKAAEKKAAEAKVAAEEAKKAALAEKAATEKAEKAAVTKAAAEKAATEKAEKAAADKAAAEKVAAEKVAAEKVAAEKAKKATAEKVAAEKVAALNNSTTVKAGPRKFGQGLLESPDPLKGTVSSDATSPPPSQDSTSSKKKSKRVRSLSNDQNPTPTQVMTKRQVVEELRKLNLQVGDRITVVWRSKGEEWRSDNGEIVRLPTASPTEILADEQRYLATFDEWKESGCECELLPQRDNDQQYLSVGREERCEFYSHPTDAKARARDVDEFLDGEAEAAARFSRYLSNRLKFIKVPKPIFDTVSKLLKPVMGIRENPDETLSFTEILDLLADDQRLKLFINFMGSEITPDHMKKFVLEYRGRRSPVCPPSKATTPMKEAISRLNCGSVKLPHPTNRLTSDYLNTLSCDARLQTLLPFLGPRIEMLRPITPEDLNSVTRLISEMNADELLGLLESETELSAKVEEALVVLKSNQFIPSEHVVVQPREEVPLVVAVDEHTVRGGPTSSPEVPEPAPVQDVEEWSDSDSDGDTKGVKRSRAKRTSASRSRSCTRGERPGKRRTHRKEDGIDFSMESMLRQKLSMFVESAELVQCYIELLEGYPMRQVLDAIKSPAEMSTLVRDLHRRAQEKYRAAAALVQMPPSSPEAAPMSQASTAPPQQHVCSESCLPFARGKQEGNFYRGYFQGAVNFINQYEAYVHHRLEMIGVNKDVMKQLADVIKPASETNVLRGKLCITHTVDILLSDARLTKLVTFMSSDLTPLRYMEYLQRGMYHPPRDERVSSSEVMTEDSSQRPSPPDGNDTL